MAVGVVCSNLWDSDGVKKMKRKERGMVRRWSLEVVTAKVATLTRGFERKRVKKEAGGWT